MGRGDLLRVIRWLQEPRRRVSMYGRGMRLCCGDVRVSLWHGGSIRASKTLELILRLIPAAEVQV